VQQTGFAHPHKTVTRIASSKNTFQPIVGGGYLAFVTSRPTLAQGLKETRQGKAVKLKVKELRESYTQTEQGRKQNTN
jgi:hypothetical protein